MLVAFQLNDIARITSEFSFQIDFTLWFCLHFVCPKILHPKTPFNHPQSNPAEHSNFQIIKFKLTQSILNSQHNRVAFHLPIVFHSSAPWTHPCIQRPLTAITKAIPLPQLKNSSSKSHKFQTRRHNWKKHNWCTVTDVPPFGAMPSSRFPHWNWLGVDRQKRATFFASSSQTRIERILIETAGPAWYRLTRRGNTPRGRGHERAAGQR